MTGLPARQRAVEGALRPHVNAVLCWFGNSEKRNVSAQFRTKCKFIHTAGKKLCTS